MHAGDPATNVILSVSPGDALRRDESAEGDMQLPPDAPPVACETDLESLLAANDTIAFLVVQDDTILYERYFQGHTPSSISQLFSVSKSVTGALFGMAIADGLCWLLSSSISCSDRECGMRHLL